MPKKKSKKESNVVHIHEPSDELYFSEMDLVKLQLMQQKLQSAAQAVQLKMYEMAEFKRHIELRAQKLDHELRQLQEDKREVEEKYKQFQDYVKEQYGFGLDEISYDDETGKITLLDKEKEEEDVPADDQED